MLPHLQPQGTHLPQFKYLIVQRLFLSQVLLIQIVAYLATLLGFVRAPQARSVTIRLKSLGCGIFFELNQISLKFPKNSAVLADNGGGRMRS
jgi:hypothetical protein